MKTLRVGIILPAALVAVEVPALAPLAQERWLLTLDDQSAIRDVSYPQVSPDGA